MSDGSQSVLLTRFQEFHMLIIDHPSDGFHAFLSCDMHAHSLNSSHRINGVTIRLVKTGDCVALNYLCNSTGRDVSQARASTTMF